MISNRKAIKTVSRGKGLDRSLINLFASSTREYETGNIRKVELG